MHKLSSLLLLVVALAACGEPDTCAHDPCVDDLQCQAQQAGAVCGPLAIGGEPTCYMPCDLNTAQSGCDCKPLPGTVAGASPAPGHCDGCGPCAADPCVDITDCEAGEACGPENVGGPSVCYVPCDFTAAFPWCPGSGICQPGPNVGGGGVGSGVCSPICGGG